MTESPLAGSTDTKLLIYGLFQKGRVLAQDGHPLAATIGDSARCMQNLEKVLFTGPKTSDTVTFICD